MGSKKEGYTSVALALFILTLAGCASAPIKKSEAVLWPPLPQKPRVQYLTTISSELSLAQEDQSSFRDFVVGTEQKPVAKLGQILALGHSEHFLYALDTYTKGVVKIDLEFGDFTPIRDMRGGPLQGPTSIFVDRDKRVYMVDKKRREILVYNERDEFELSYSTGEDSQPVDVLVNDDSLFVSSLARNDILVFDKITGEHISTLGGLGTTEGLFNKPTNLAFSSAGDIAVVDSFNNRVQVLDTEGNGLKSVGSIGRGLGAMVRPKGIAYDREDRLYVADAAFELVSIWDMQIETPVLVFGEPNSGASVYLPSDVEIDYLNVGRFQRFAHPDFDMEYVIYVSNSLGGISVFGFGEWTGSLDAPKRRRQSDNANQTQDSGNAPMAVEELNEVGAQEP